MVAQMVVDYPNNKNGLDFCNFKESFSETFHLKCTNPSLWSIKQKELFLQAPHTSETRLFLSIEYSIRHGSLDSLERVSEHWNCSGLLLMRN